MSISVAAGERGTPAGPSVGTDKRASPLAVGVMVWLASEVMFFGGLFAAWFVLKAHNGANWPPPNHELDAARMGIFTAVLIASSVTMHFAVEAAEHNRRVSALRWMSATVVLGLAFLVHEGIEWSGLAFSFDTSAYSSIFYLLTGFHGAHVLGGLVLMTVVSWVVFAPGSRVPLGQSFRVTSYYWHFVDVVWVFLFLTVYILR